MLNFLAGFLSCTQCGLNFNKRKTLLSPRMPGGGQLLEGSTGITEQGFSDDTQLCKHPVRKLSPALLHSSKCILRRFFLINKRLLLLFLMKCTFRPLHKLYKKACIFIVWILPFWSQKVGRKELPKQSTAEAACARLGRGKRCSWHRTGGTMVSSRRSWRWLRAESCRGFGGQWQHLHRSDGGGNHSSHVCSGLCLANRWYHLQISGEEERTSWRAV